MAGRSLANFTPPICRGSAKYTTALPDERTIRLVRHARPPGLRPLRAGARRRGGQHRPRRGAPALPAGRRIRLWWRCGRHRTHPIRPSRMQAVNGARLCPGRGLTAVSAMSASAVQDCRRVTSSASVAAARRTAAGTAARSRTPAAATVSNSWLVATRSRVSRRVADRARRSRAAADSSAIGSSGRGCSSWLYTVLTPFRDSARTHRIRATSMVPRSPPPRRSSRTPSRRARCCRTPADPVVPAAWRKRSEAAMTPGVMHGHIEISARVGQRRSCGPRRTWRLWHCLESSDPACVQYECLPALVNGQVAQPAGAGGELAP